MAMRIDSSDNLRPTAVIDGAWSQSLECGTAATLSLAMSVSVLESSSKSLLKIAVVIGVSHAFCTCFVVFIGIVVFARAIQILFASVTVWSSMLCTDPARMAFWSGSVAAAEAKKAEDASMHALLTPRLPM